MWNCVKIEFLVHMLYKNCFSLLVISADQEQKLTDKKMCRS